jgi:Fe-Mn family superoxide dismutase
LFKKDKILLIYKIMLYELPKLKYKYDALEPLIDARTMEIHHTKHHATYTNNLNSALKDSGLEGKNLELLFSEASKLPVAIRNNGGGYYNHNLYWDTLAPGGSTKPEGELLEAVKNAFGNEDIFKDTFVKAALTRFGSGWAWLVKNDKALAVSSTPNQDNPLMDIAEVQGVPILCIDVWEHAYYLNYQNRRSDYIEAFWKLINWDEVARRFKG